MRRSERQTVVRCRVVGVLVATVMLAAACGDGADSSTSGTTTPEDDATPAPSVTPTTTASTVPAPPTTDAPLGRWEQWPVELDTTGIATQSDIPAGSPDLHAIASTSVGFVAAGSVNGGLTVWRSTDLTSFEPVYSEVCCERRVQAWTVGEFAGTLLIGGTGEFDAGRLERAALLRSDDGGASWTSIDDPLFVSDANRVDRIVTTGEVVLVEALDDRGSGQPRSVASWSRDLVTWQRVELPGQQPDDWPWFVPAADVVYAVAQRNDGPDGQFGSWMIWRSTDGGATFTELPSLTEMDIGGFLAVENTLVAIPSAFQYEFRHTEAQGLHVLTGDQGWRALEPHTGTWGDGHVWAYPTTARTTDGGTYTVVTREPRASVHYCYDDVSTCQQRQQALLVTDDGTRWSDVAGYPADDDTLSPLLLAAGSDGAIVVLSSSYRDEAIHVTRWTGSGQPQPVTTPDYPAADIPLPLYDPERPLVAGEEVRYPLGLGGCGGLDVDDVRWEPETPLPDPPPADWPYRPVQYEDGPAGYLYGTVRRIDDDTIEYVIDDIGTVATFHPGADPEFIC